MVVVSDTSPLTALLTTGAEDLVRKLFTEVVTPRCGAERIASHPRLTETVRDAALQTVSE